MCEVRPGRCQPFQSSDGTLFVAEQAPFLFLCFSRSGECVSASLNFTEEEVGVRTHDTPKGTAEPGLNWAGKHSRS